MSFQERLTAPTRSNFYYIRKENNGYNPCIKGNTAKIPLSWAGCVLPNCVGYATGRFNEIGAYKSCKYLGNTNAVNFANLAKSQGLTVNQTPSLGACMVWSGGTNNCGHVAIVEQILSDSEVVVSESGWSANKIFWTANHKKGTNSNWTTGSDASWMGTKYKFIGFIVNPAVPADFIPTMKQGAKGVYVKALQENLNTIGDYKLTVDGSFGAATLKAVKDFQSKHGLTVDGSVGPATQKAILAALEDLKIPEGVEWLEFIVGLNIHKAWATKIDDEWYVRLNSLPEVDLATSVAYNEKVKMLEITK